MADRSRVPRDLLVRGIASAKAGEHREARRYLERYLWLGPPHKERIDALFYLSLITEDPAEKRTYLEDILAWDPVEPRARRQLAILNGELDPDQIVDPDRLPGQETGRVNAARKDRFTCPNCGGRLTFAPDGHSLTCEYCEVQAFQSDSRGQVEDENFMVALATARGHSRAVNTRVLHCSGCGADFLVPPRQISWQCPYCQSNYAVEQVEERAIIQPNSLIPFSVSEEQARQTIRRWTKENLQTDVNPAVTLQGIYLPMWTFDIGGFLSWQVEVNQKNFWQTISGDKGVFYDDLRVPATRQYAELLPELLESYNLRQLVPFDSRYLANWLAETYDIPAGNAALLARETALDLEQDAIMQLQLHPARDLRVNSSRMTVEQYKLVLLPVWSGHIQLSDEHIPFLLNGQTGKPVVRQSRPSADQGWFARLFGGRD